MNQSEKCYTHLRSDGAVDGVEVGATDGTSVGALVQV